MYGGKDWGKNNDLNDESYYFSGQSSVHFSDSRKHSVL